MVVFKQQKKTRSIPLFGLATRLISNNKGVAAVETALVLPVFLLLMLATVDYGSLFYVQHKMNTVANEVSRNMALGNLSLSEAETEAGNQLPGWSSATFSITASEPTSTEVQITISVPKDQVALVNLSSFGFADNISVTAVKRKI